MTKPNFCSACPITNVTEGYVPLKLGYGRELFVGDHASEECVRSGVPQSGGHGAWFNSLLKAARINRASLNMIDCIGCHPPGNEFPTDEKFEELAVEALANKYAGEEGINLKRCDPQELGRIYAKARASAPTRDDARRAVQYCAQQHLWPAVAAVNPIRIVTLGDEALSTLSPRHGALTWRGSPLPLRGALTGPLRIVPTLHPRNLMKMAHMFSVVKQDMRRGLEISPENYKLYASLEDLQAFQSTEFSFDFEWDYQGNISLCGLSDRYFQCLVVPFVEPYIAELRRIFEAATVFIGQNIIGADMKYFDRLKWRVNAKVVDIMLIQHLVMPDMKHDMGFIGSVFSSKVFWKGRGEETEDDSGNAIPTGAQWKTWDSPDAIPRGLGGYGGCRTADEAYRLYNARDTEGAFQCAAPLLSTLKHFELENTYWNVSVPIAYLCRDMGEAGLRVDNERVRDIRDEIAINMLRIEGTLPDALKPFEQPCMRSVAAPPNTYKPKIKKCKGKKADDTQHAVVSISFSNPVPANCPTCGVLVPAPKMVALKKIKIPSTNRIVPWNSADQVKRYATELGCKPYLSGKTGRAVADKNARKTWGREFVQFAAVDQLKKLGTQASSFAKPELLAVPRVYFNLLVHGTSEGRLSSSGQRRGIDPNIQNQPKMIRKIFVPDERGWGFLDSDIVQGENMITTWLAKDWERWDRLCTPGYDEHADMASAFFNLPVTKDNEHSYLRGPGKIINHGRNYGLGVKKTQEYLAAQGFFYSIADITEMMAIWKKKNSRTAAWQAETIELAQRQSFLENAFGRRRWFQGRDFATKSLAFLPASTLADVVFRCMIALRPDQSQCASAIQALRIGVTGTVAARWKMSIQVHDSLVYQGPDETHLDTARTIRSVMTQPWPELDGFRLDVEQQYSTSSWGTVKKIHLDDAPPLRLAA